MVPTWFDIKNIESGTITKIHLVIYRSLKFLDGYWPLIYSEAEIDLRQEIF